jgi:hypothetical protein
VRIEVNPALRPKELQGKIGQIARSFAVKRIAQDAARFLLHRMSMFGGAHPELGFEAVFEISYRDACHHFSPLRSMQPSEKNDIISLEFRNPHRNRAMPDRPLPPRDRPRYQTLALIKNQADEARAAGR